MYPWLPQAEGLPLSCQPASLPATILLPEFRPCHLQTPCKLRLAAMGGIERAVKLLEGMSRTSVGSFRNGSHRPYTVPSSGPFVG